VRTGSNPTDGRLPPVTSTPIEVKAGRSVKDQAGNVAVKAKYVLPGK